jgi:hypothetical protein
VNNTRSVQDNVAALEFSSECVGGCQVKELPAVDVWVLLSKRLILRQRIVRERRSPGESCERVATQRSEKCLRQPARDTGDREP